MNDYITLEFEGMSDEEAMDLLGTHDRYLTAIADAFDTEIWYRSSVFYIRKDCDPEKVTEIRSVLDALHELSLRGVSINEQDVIYACRLAKRHEKIDFDAFGAKIVGRTLSGKVISPKTRGQLEFVTAMEENPVVFAIGPAGTGKTYLAVIQAVTALKKDEVRRIVLTRPAVEAGESLGFLPGDLKEKVDPYLTPLYDALHDMLGVEQTEKLIEKGTIEIAPLAYMRGRTLNDAYVILDEAQNTTRAQMKMFLTRLGFHSHMIITGDVTQIDLNHNVKSGLIEASKILEGIPEIKVLHLSADDVVRHPLVQKIIERYGKFEERSE